MDKAIDATMGNGIDTLFLAKKIGTNGKIYAFDIQNKSVQKSKKLFEKNRITNKVEILQKSHEKMRDSIPPYWLGKVNVIMFNLGYLPGGDQSIVTKPESTIKALESSFQFLKKGGLLTIIAYRGHKGGEIESNEVSRWIKKNSGSLKSQAILTNNPILHICEKL